MTGNGINGINGERRARHPWLRLGVVALVSLALLALLVIFWTPPTGLPTGDNAKTPRGNRPASRDSAPSETEFEQGDVPADSFADSIAVIDRQQSK